MIDSLNKLLKTIQETRDILKEYSLPDSPMHSAECVKKINNLFDSSELNAAVENVKSVLLVSAFKIIEEGF